MTNSVFTAVRFGVYTLSGVFFIPYLVRRYGTGAYGLIALAGFLTQYVGLVQRCVGNAVARFLAIALNQHDWKQANEIFCTALMANIGFILIQAPILALAVWKLDVLIDFPPEAAADFRFLVLCNIAVFFITMVTGVLSTPIQAANRLDVTSTVDSVRLVLRMAFLFMLIEGIGAKLWIIGMVDLALALANSSWIAFMCRRLASELRFAWRYVTRKWIRPVMNMAGWSIVTALGGYLFVKTDVWMINRFVDPGQAGLYAALLVWPNYLRQVSKQLASVLAPVYMIDYARGDTDRVARVSLSSAKLLGCFVGFCVGGLYVVAEPLLGIWLDSGAAQYANLFRVMLIYLTFTIGEAVLWQIYTTLNKVHYTGIVSLSAGVLNIVISLLLIHAGYGAMGVAIGTAVTQVFASALAIPIGVCREFKIPIRRVWWNYFCAMLLLAVSGVATKVAWHVFEFSIVGGVVSFLLLLGTGLTGAWFIVFSAEEKRLLGRLSDKVKIRMGLQNIRAWDS